MENKKYQIFVSSTYEDLKEERKTIIENISKLGHLPIGMELFVASNDEQFKYIQRVIDNCDYYILIIGGRYGSISPKTGISYTEMEFDYACEKGIPVLVFPYENIESLPDNKKDVDLSNIKSFITKAKHDRLANFWKEEKILLANVIIALQDQFTTNPQRGWIRPDEADNTQFLYEINELRKEKELLEKEIKDLKESKANDIYNIDNIAEFDEEYTIHYSFKSTDIYADDMENDTINLTWNEIFGCVGALYLSPYYESYFASSLNTYISERNPEISNVEIFESDINTIKIQFLALKLLEPDTMKNPQGYVEYLLKLTEKGHDYLAKLKTVKTKKKNKCLN